MDIIKIKGSESILDLNQIGLGHSVSIKAISDILEKLSNFKSINLSYNSISFDRVDIIIPQLKGLRKINLSHNRIGKQGVDLLAT
jgi:Leucine-rich repeat (LRR) protein